METQTRLQQIFSSGAASFYNKRNIAADPTPSPTGDSSSATGYSERDTVTLSQEGKDRSSGLDSPRAANGSETPEEQHSHQEIEQLRKLKRRDQEVRSHEQAHLAAAGQYARGGMSLTYQRGPDGVSYAVAGKVGIDLSKEATPEATVLKMQTVRRAALAPANPSGADRQIAALATAKAAQARQEIQRSAQEKTENLIAGFEKNDALTPPATSDPEIPAPPSSSYGSLKSAIAAYQRLVEF